MYFKEYYRQNMHKYNIIKKPLTSLVVTITNRLEKEKEKELRTKRMHNLLTY